MSGYTPPLGSRAEYAKSARSSCGKCRVTIPKGALRIGIGYNFKGAVAFKWYHSHCAPALGPGEIEGLDELHPADAHRLRSAPPTGVDPGGACNGTVTTTMDNANPGGVYVLELQGGNFYVGKSEDCQNRIAQHRAGGKYCARWVAIHGPVVRALEPITPPVSELGNWEMNETLARMMENGFNKVRGFEWTGSGDLSREELASVRALCCGMGDLCRRCGLGGHMATACSMVEGEGMAPWMKELRSLSGIGTPGNVAATLQALASTASRPPPRAQTHKKRKVELPVWCCSYCGSEFATKKGVTFHENVHCRRRHSHREEEGGSSDCGASGGEDGSCFRCGRAGHFATSCYAKRHIDGYFIG